MSLRLRVFVVGVVLAVATAALCHADAGATAGQVQQIVDGSNQTWWQKAIDSMTGNMLYALTAAMETGLYIIWLAVTWAVIKLYSAIGTYLIPIWDFSNTVGFFNLATEGSAFNVVTVPAQASAMLWSMVPWVLSLCGILMVGLLAVGIPKSLLSNRQPFDSVSGMMWGVGLMVAFPFLYAVPIHVGNFVGREFYEESHNRYMINSGQGANGTPTGLFDALLSASLFPQDTQDPSQLTTNAAAAVGQTAVTAATQGLPATVQGSALSMSAPTFTNTQQLSDEFSGIVQATNPNSKPGIASAWDHAKQGMMVNLEMQSSRFIQIVLGVMAIVGLIGLLMLKGAQIVSLILNFYLGWIACALYVHPGTRVVFGNWLKAHIQLCMWGLIWALLIFVMDIIVLAGTGMQGMVQRAGAPSGVFMSIGLFMMPFILFGAIFMFKDVKEFVNSLATTGNVAASAGGAMHAAFMGGGGKVPGGLAGRAGGASMHGAAGTGAQLMSNSFSSGMEKVTSMASKAAMAIPGVGQAAAAGITVAGKVAGQAGGAALNAGGKAAQGVNRFHRASQIADKVSTSGELFKGLQIGSERGPKEARMAGDDMAGGGASEAPPKV